MKMKLSVIVFLCFVTGTTFGQVYNPISWSAILKDASEAPLVSTAVPLKFSFKTTLPGTTHYIETQTVTTDEHGFASVLIGTGTAVTGSYDTVGWSNPTLSLKIEADFGSGYETLSEAAMSAVPYSMYANKADYAKHLQSDDELTKILSSSNKLSFYTSDEERLAIATNGQVTIKDLANPSITRNRPVFVTPTGLLVDTPSLHYYTLCGADFVSESNKNIGYSLSSGVTQIDTMSGSLTAAIHLPHNAQLVSMKVYYKDYSVTKDISWDLMRLNISTNTNYSLSYFTSSGSSATSSDFFDRNYLPESYYQQ